MMQQERLSVSAPQKATFLTALRGELEEEPILKFRLTYQGPLRATQREAFEGQVDRLASHKQDIRKCFHRQLKQLWKTNDFLRDYKRHPDVSIDSRSISSSAAHLGSKQDKIPLVEYISKQHREHGYRFVPLVRDEFSLLCSLDILFLRRDIPGSAIQAGDIDNRVKTIIDGLRKPKYLNELKGNETPGDGEDPFFCLLEDDKLVSHFSCETDTLLDEIIAGEEDQRKARAIITVEVRPYFPTFFNMAFS